MSIKELSPEIIHSGDVLPDQIPGIHDLHSDFNHLLSGFTNNRYRVGLAIEYAEYLKSRFEPTVYSSSDQAYAKEQILPRLYLDTFVLLARRQEHHSVTKSLSQKRSPESLPVLHALINAKLDLQKNIAEYVELNPDKSSMIVFGNISQVMHQTRRLLYDDEVTEERAKNENLSQLSGILAEHKVLSALREGWPLATFGSVEQDTGGTDIVIPTQQDPSMAVALQVKSNRKAGGELSINDNDCRVPIVSVPMNTIIHDPLKLSWEHAKTLRKFITIAPTYSLATAA